MTDPVAAPVLVLRAVVPATPHTCLRPNHRAPRIAKWRAGMDLKEAAFLAAVDALSGAGFAAVPADGPLWLEAAVYWEKGRRRQDLDGCISSLKGAIDGACRALGADDGRIRGISVDQVTTTEPQGAVFLTVYAGPWPWGGGADAEERA